MSVTRIQEILSEIGKEPIRLDHLQQGKREILEEKLQLKREIQAKLYDLKNIEIQLAKYNQKRSTKDNIYRDEKENNLYNLSIIERTAQQIEKYEK